MGSTLTCRVVREQGADFYLIEGGREKEKEGKERERKEDGGGARERLQL